MPDLTQTAVYCPNCSYDLRGLAPSEEGKIRCPECGAAFVGTSLTESPIPWSHRTNIGRVRAFVKTVRLAVLHPRKLAAHMAGPVSLADAQAFRRVVIWLNFVPVLLLFAGDFASRLIATGRLRQFDLSLANLGDLLELAQFKPSADTFKALYDCILSLGLIIPEPWNALLFLPGFLLFLIFATGVQTYFFQPRHLPATLQARGVALGYYVTAPLTLGAPALFLALGGCVLLPWIFTLPLAARLAAYGLSFGPGVVCLGVFWVNGLVLLRNATRCSRTRLAISAVLWPVLELVSAAVALGVPLALGILATFIVLSMK